MNERIFESFRYHFPFSCVDLIVIKGHKFVLVKRTIPPYKGKWCLPGGIIRRGENMKAAVERIAKSELGIKVKIIRSIGFYEKIFQSRHDISHCFLCKYVSGTLKTDFQSDEVRFFNIPPSNLALFHFRMLKDAELVKS